MNFDPNHKLFAVHHDLIAVLQRTLQDPQPFQIVYGIRTLEAEKQAVASGHSQTMHSRHLPNKDGVACAVDVAAIIDGKVSFAAGHEAAVFGAIARQIKYAAAQLKIPVEWGGDWRTFKDWGHFQLPWTTYP